MCRHGRFPLYILHVHTWGSGGAGVLPATAEKTGPERPVLSEWKADLGPYPGRVSSSDVISFHPGDCSPGERR